ncbi:putative apurinic-apyrimidinic endonuclease 1 [Carp edema virus]|nr:putative apurinic-apyrimidinic endonuclease 1 [Carp edema virus]
MFKFVCLNLNGIKSAIDKNFESYIKGTKADVYCLQETRITDQTEVIKTFDYIGYDFFNNAALDSKRGGTGFLIKKSLMNRVQCYKCMYEKMITSSYGRVSLLVLDNELFIFNVYLHFTSTLDNTFLEKIRLFNKLKEEIGILLSKNKKVVCCGDFNIKTFYENNIISSDYFEEVIKTSYEIEYQRYTELEKMIRPLVQNNKLMVSNREPNWSIDFIDDKIILKAIDSVSINSDEVIFKDLEMFEYYYKILKLNANKKIVNYDPKVSNSLLEQKDKHNIYYKKSQHKKEIFMLESLERILTRHIPSNYEGAWMLDYVFSNLKTSILVDNSIKLSDHPIILGILEYKKIN